MFKNIIIQREGEYCAPRILNKKPPFHGKFRIITFLSILSTFPNLPFLQPDYIHAIILLFFSMLGVRAKYIIEIALQLGLNYPVIWAWLQCKKALITL